MKLFSGYTYPGEVPAPSEMMHDVYRANFSPYGQVLKENNPFILETESALDFFCLDNVQRDEISQVGKRALTLLMWLIDDATQDGSTLDYLHTWYDDWISELPEDERVDFVESYSLTPEGIQNEHARAEEKFVKLVGECIDMASLVVSGNETLAYKLSEEYTRKVSHDVEEIRRNEKPTQIIHSANGGYIIKRAGTDANQS